MKALVMFLSTVMLFLSSGEAQPEFEIVEFDFDAIEEIYPEDEIIIDDLIIDEIEFEEMLDF